MDAEAARSGAELMFLIMMSAAIFNGAFFMCVLAWMFKNNVGNQCRTCGRSMGETGKKLPVGGRDST